MSDKLIKEAVADKYRLGKYEPNDGGPAFAAFCESHGQCGMTLLDYFAAAALQGMLASNHYTSLGKDLAGGAYIIAETMVAEKRKREGAK